MLLKDFEMDIGTIILVEGELSLVSMTFLFGKVLLCCSIMVQHSC